MDNFTHTMTGVLLARAGLGKLAPRGAWLMAAALNSPDIDVLWSWGRQGHVYLDHHRGFTHSIFFTPLIALVPLIVTRQFSRETPLPWKAWLAAFLGVLTHIAQDTTNVYGIRSLWPASKNWFRLDWVSVVDPWIWALLLIGLFWPVLAGMVSGEIGSKRGSGAGWARTVLVMLALYVGTRGVLHGRAVDMIAARSWDGLPLQRAAAFPSAFNPLQWTGIAETSEAWNVLPVDLTRDLNPDRARRFVKIPPDQAAAATEPFRVFLYFSQFPIWTAVTAPDGESREVSVCDARFGLPGEGGFCASATVRPDGKVIDANALMARPGTLPKPR